MTSFRFAESGSLCLGPLSPGSPQQTVAIALWLPGAQSLALVLPRPPINHCSRAAGGLPGGLIRVWQHDPPGAELGLTHAGGMVGAVEADTVPAGPDGESCIWCTSTSGRGVAVAYTCSSESGLVEVGRKGPPFHLL